MLLGMAMRILVCVKLVPSTTQVELDGQFRLRRDGTSLQLNIADLSALECALDLKAAQPGSEVTVLSMGPAKAETALTELFALGVDRIVLLCDRVLAGADSLATTRTLAVAAKHLGDFDCILCGRRALDAETGQIPGQLAAALNVPVATNVQTIRTCGEDLDCSRRLETGISHLRLKTPAVISLCEYSYTLRLPSILGRRRALGRKIELLTAEDIGLQPESCGLKGSATKVIHVDTKAPGLRKCKYLTANETVKVIREADR